MSRAIPDPPRSRDILRRFSALEKDPS